MASSNYKTVVSDEEVDEAVHFLAGSAERAAASKAELVYCEEYRKSLKAMLMAEHSSKPIGAQEREAYRDQRYLDHLEKLKKAVYENELIKAQRAAAEQKIEAWRTEQANYRSIKL